MPQGYPQAPLGQSLIHRPYQPHLGRQYNIQCVPQQVGQQLQAPVLPPEGQSSMPAVLSCDPASRQMLPGAGSEPQQFHDPHEIIQPEHSASEESFKERIKCQLDKREITVELTVDNYQRKFNNLICWEENSNIEILGRK